MDKNRLEELIEQDCTQRQIGKLLGVSQSNVRYWLSKYNLQTGRIASSLGNTSGPPPSYSKEELQIAVQNSESWYGVGQLLGIKTQSKKIQSRAEIWGIKSNHFVEKVSFVPPLANESPDFEPKSFWIAAQHLASAWYTMHGFVTSSTNEQARYDLIADNGSEPPKRVQVKSSVSSTHRFPLTSQKYDRSAPNGANGRRVTNPYLAHEVDEFFFVLDRQEMFRVPVDAIRLEIGILLPGSYKEYQVHF